MPVEGVSLHVVRAARYRAKESFGTEYPLATARLQTDGCGIFSDLSEVEDVPHEKLQWELSRGQLACQELVEPFFRKNIDFTESLAVAYWPMGRDKPVLLDAHRAFDRPIIKRTGTPTLILHQMQQAGESFDRIVSWYSLTPEELNTALAYEESLCAAA